MNIVTTDLDKDRGFHITNSSQKDKHIFKRHGQLGNIIVSFFCSFAFTRSVVNINYRYFLRV